MTNWPEAVAFMTLVIVLGQCYITYVKTTSRDDRDDDDDDDDDDGRDEDEES
jgi:hypothetical protein